MKPRQTTPHQRIFTVLVWEKISKKRKFWAYPIPKRKVIKGDFLWRPKMPLWTKNAKPTIFVFWTSGSQKGGGGSVGLWEKFSKNPSFLFVGGFPNFAWHKCYLSNLPLQLICTRDHEWWRSQETPSRPPSPFPQQPELTRSWIRGPSYNLMIYALKCPECLLVICIHIAFSGHSICSPNIGILRSACQPLNTNQYWVWAG